jgi:hypothetical protein
LTRLSYLPPAPIASCAPNSGWLISNTVRV